MTCMFHFLYYSLIIWRSPAYTITKVCFILLLPTSVCFVSCRIQAQLQCMSHFFSVFVQYCASLCLSSVISKCYVLTLPLVFSLLHPILISPLRLGIRPHLPWLLYLSSLTLFQLTPLISFYVLPLNPFPLVALCDHGPTICIALPPFAHTVQILMIGGSAWQLAPMWPMHIALSTRPSVSSTFAPPITLMVITGMLGSYPWTCHLMFQLTPHGLTIVSLFLLFLAIVRSLLCLALLFPFPYCPLFSIVPE